LATFIEGDRERAGVLVGDELVDVSVATPELPWDVAGLLAGGAETAARLSQAVDSGSGRISLSSVTLAPPVRPSKFFAIGLNYADHVAESGFETPERLTVFTKAISCVTGPYAAIERPVVSDQLDYEGELGVVIGRRCRHVDADAADSVIGGYVVVNDVSVRDWQLMTAQWTLGKSFDTHGPIGPWVVTPDEIDDPHSLDIRTFVNGDLRQSSNTRQLIFNCYRQIAILSQVCTLEPGDVIATGTPSGVAQALPGQPWLVPGDIVRVEIEKIGAIENTVVQEIRRADRAEAQVPAAAGERL
jgi:2-keto-4-pentenoate hydratase/2-oxohepta-3-ene-1,7-dioic acid hydratase in catechol pathway